jgi:hypothetical protein
MVEEECSKLATYNTFLEAQKFAWDVYRKSGGILETWPYQCPYCLSYHTSGSFIKMMKLKEMTDRVLAQPTPLADKPTRQ